MTELTRENPTIYPDEVALVNMYRQMLQELPTGYGEMHFTVEVVDHSIRSIEVVVEARIKIDTDGPPIEAVIGEPTTKAT